MAPIGSPAKIIPTLAMSSPQKSPLLPPSEQTRTKHPHNNDVLCGRGGTINAHPGNEQYRTFVERKKRVYLTARFKREKRLIAQSIVDEIRKLDPPGRFLQKESGSDYWFDVGNEKARDKTSQALRENSMSVKRQMEEEFNETRRQQARDAAIATGRDQDKAAEEMSKPHLEPPPSGGLQPPPPTGGLQPRLTGLQPPGPGFMGGSGYGPLYDAQQPTPPAQSTSQHHLQGGLHQPQYDYREAHPYEHPSHATPYPPPTSYYVQQDQHRAAAAHAYQYAYAPHTSHQMMPRPTYDPNMASNPQYAHHVMAPRSASPHLQPGHHVPAVMVDQHHPNISHHPEPDAPTHPDYHHQAQRPDPTSALRRHSSKGSLERHVQFQATENPRHDMENAPQFPPLANNETDIPLVIGAKTRSPKRHPQPRSEPYHSGDQMHTESPPHHQVYASSPEMSPPQTHHYQDETMTVSSPKTTQSGFSQADMSQATPLTFMSNPLSLKTEDSLAKYLQGIEDEITGDVGQEVELVAHAPMLNSSERSHEHETIVPRHHRHHHGSVSGRSAVDSHASSSHRGTPPRHHKSSSRRRRKHRSAGHIPSNSGKVQLDLSAAAFEGSTRDASSPIASAREEGPCGQVAVSCGGILPVPSPIIGRRQNQETATSPMYPLSPNSLDLDKMSLCGTENISHGGSLIGGASLMNVFEEHDSLVGANALMDMSVSLGSGAQSSSASSLRPMGLQQPAAEGHAQEQFGEHDSLMGASALMDLSVGSQSKSSKTHSSSSDSSKKNRRSLSPASIDKRYSQGPAVEAGYQAASQDQGGWTWDEKSKE